jgi:hypothetical protein
MEEDYDVMQKRISKANEKLMKKFAEHLLEKKLTTKTIEKHCSNMDFYGNDYLLNYESCTLTEGSDCVSPFLGSWFIRKCMWSSQTTMKEYITSFKKFYGWMYDTGKLSKNDYDLLLFTNKEEKETWLETVRKYNDPDIDFEDVFPY